MRKLYLLTLAILMVTCKVTCLSGENVCVREEIRSVPIFVSETYDVQVRIVYCDYAIGKTCIDTRHFFRTVTMVRYVTKYVEAKVNASICCQGYEESNNACIPKCTGACVHGTCSGPEICTCGIGYTGITCETPICSNVPCINGMCVAPDKCDCTGTDYTGSSCNVLICSKDNQLCKKPCANTTAAGECVCERCYVPLNGGCFHDFKCLINSTCYKGGEGPLHGCLKCIPVVSHYSWTPMSSSRICDDGDACTTNGQCDGQGACIEKQITCGDDCETCIRGDCVLNNTCHRMNKTTTSPPTTKEPGGISGGIKEGDQCDSSILHQQHPTDCTKFFYCVSEKILRIVQCPSNTFFNPNNQVCDHKANHPGTGCNLNNGP